MDIAVLLGIVGAIVVLGGLYAFVFTKSKPTPAQTELAVADNEPIAQPHGRIDGLSRMRQRHRRAVVDEIPEEQELPQESPQAHEAQGALEPMQEEDIIEDAVATDTKKVGKKKAEKQKAKEQAREMRQALQEQQARKISAQKERDEEEKARKELEKEEEMKLEEDLAKVRAEREKREEEEYQKWKAEISVQEAGTDELDEKARAEQEALFVDTLKKRKVARLEDIAIEFKMKTTEVVELIKSLDSRQLLTGVIDDRGKFIYITKEEFDAVAKFIVRKGRVSIQDIAKESNRLINLEESL